MPPSPIFSAQLEGLLGDAFNPESQPSPSPSPSASASVSTSAFPVSPHACPRPDLSVHHGPAPASLTTYTSPSDPSDPNNPNLVQPFPLPPSAPEPLPTPPLELLPSHQELSLAFPPIPLPDANIAPPALSAVKAGLDLRLPSFSALGLNHPPASFSSLGAGPLSKPEDPLHALSPPLAQPHHFGGVADSVPATPEVVRCTSERRVPTVTPPADTDSGASNWGAELIIEKPAGLGSPRFDPGVAPNIVASASAAARSETRNPLSVAHLRDALGMAAWVETVKVTIATNFQPRHPDSVKVLSHALPCPSLTGHLFPQIVAGIHQRSHTPTAWVNVFHAVPGRYTLADLPKSPPSTPGTVVGGDDYFTTKVFDSAVAVPDYQLDAKLLPPSPRPVVPPGSVDVSIVERYIPPTNANEFREMFRLNGRSLLYDRLIELSPKNGLLLFIYPTKTGGKTFMQHYLGPILDPLLRSVTVVHGLSSDLGKSLGKMTAVDSISEYETLHADMERFCHSLNEGPSDFCASPEGNGAVYTIIHSSKEEAILDRTAWASDWWIKQEKSRVRELVTKHFRPSLSELTPTPLIQEILDGVAHRKYGPTAGFKGVEVAVFIVKKSTRP